MDTKVVVPLVFIEHILSLNSCQFNQKIEVLRWGTVLVLWVACNHWTYPQKLRRFTHLELLFAIGLLTHG